MGSSEEHKKGFVEKVQEFFEETGEKIEATLGFGKPTASVTGFHLPLITLEQADVIVDILITNPNPIPIPLVDIQYLIQSDGRELISGTIPDAGTIHPHGSETIKVPITLIYQQIQDTYEDIKPGQVIPYRVEVTLIADVPVLGRLSLPLEKTGEIPVPFRPDVDIEKVEWEHLSMEETEATLHLKVENKNKFKVGVKRLQYELALAGVSIAKANMSKCAEIESEGMGFLEVPFSFRPKGLGSAVWDMVSGRGGGYSVEGMLEVETPFGPMHLPFAREGGKALFKKKGDDDDD